MICMFCDGWQRNSTPMLMVGPCDRNLCHLLCCRALVGLNTMKHNHTDTHPHTQPPPYPPLPPPTHTYPHTHTHPYPPTHTSPYPHTCMIGMIPTPPLSVRVGSMSTNSLKRDRLPRLAASAVSVPWRGSAVSLASRGAWSSVEVD